MRVLSVALEADLIVSLPLIKGHTLAGLSLSLKNMKGIIPPVEKRAFHQRSVFQGVADLATVVKPGLTIADGIIVSGNWVPGGGFLPMGLVVAGDDPVATDAVCCHLLQVDPTEIDHVRLAAELGVGEIDLERIEVLGEEIGTNSTPILQAADPLKLAAELPNIEVVVGEACSGCLNRLGVLLTKMGPEKLAALPPLAFLVGKNVAPVEGKRNVLVGVCTAEHKEAGLYLPHCPPMSDDLNQAVRYLAGEDDAMRYYWEETAILPDDQIPD
jgi:hypothetical protein